MRKYVESTLAIVDGYLALPANKETAELVKKAVEDAQGLIDQLDVNDKDKYQHQLDLKKQKMQ